MIPINQLVDKLFGSSNEAPVSARPSNWQQDLLASVDPERQRKQNISRALAAFGTALSGTKGNFLQGLAAGTGAGAQSFIEGQSQSEQQRLQALRILEDFQRQREADRRSMLRDDINTARTLNNDELAQENQAYTRKRQEGIDARAQAREDRLAAEGTRRLDIAAKRAETDARRVMGGKSGVKPGTPLTQWQQAQIKRDIERLSQEFQKSLPTAYDDQTASDNQQQIEQHRRRLFEMQGFDPDSGEYLYGTATTPGEATAPAAQGGDVPEATKVLNGKTYVKINGQWFEQ